MRIKLIKSFPSGQVASIDNLCWYPLILIFNCIDLIENEIFIINKKLDMFSVEKDRVSMVMNIEVSNQALTKRKKQSALTVYLKISKI